MVKYPVTRIKQSEYTWYGSYWKKNNIINYSNGYTDTDDKPIWIHKRVDVPLGYIDNNGTVWKVIFE